MKKIILLVAVLIIFVTGCSGSDPIPPSEKAIISFSLNGAAGTINETGKSIAVTMPFGTDVTALVATFTTTGASIQVGSTVQISGTTANNFTSQVIYKVTAADGSTQDYTVVVAAWVNVATSTEFTPRDSSPNALLYYKNAFWILEGYRYTGIDYVYSSSSDVWYSKNGRNWTLVNDNPPYYPYSVFVVFNDYMWAIGSIDSYRSKDGLNWERVEPGPFEPMRGTVFRDKIWIVDVKQRVWSTENGLAWTLVADKTPWPARQWPAWVSLNGRLWLFGGAVMNNSPNKEGYYTDPTDDLYYNDVWASEDGEHWSLITPAAPWPGRYWSGYAAYYENLWILGGYREDNSDNYGNLNDVWFSADGVRWEKQTGVPWSPRHAMFIWVAEGSLWMSSGYSGGGYPYLHNDVWQLLP